MPAESLSIVLDDLLDAYETVEDPRRLIDVLLQVLVERLELTRGALLTPVYDDETTGRYLLRSKYSQETGRHHRKRKGGEIHLPESLVETLRSGSQCLNSRPEGLDPWITSFDVLVPLFRREQPEGLLLLDGTQHDPSLHQELLGKGTLRRLGSLFLPALISHRAFSRFLRFEASTGRQHRVSKEMRLRTPAERIFPRARNLLSDVPMFILQYQEDAQRLTDLAMTWRDAAVVSFFRRGVEARGAMAKAVRAKCPTLLIRCDSGEYRLDGDPVALQAEEEALFDGRSFALVPIVFESTVVGVFGYASNDLTSLQQPKVRTFFSTLGRLIFFASIYRSLLIDSYRVDILGWAARKLGEGKFRVDRELVQKTVNRHEPPEVLEAKSLADLASDLRGGLDDLVTSFHRLVGFVDTLYKVGIAGLEGQENVRDYLQTVVRIIRDRLGYEKVVALQADNERRVLHSASLSWVCESEEQAAMIQKVEVPFDMDRSVWAWVAKNQRELDVPDAHAEFVKTDDGHRVYIRKEWIDLFKANSFFTVPLLSRPAEGASVQLLGVLSIASLFEDPIDMSDRNVIRAVTRQVALTLENASLHDEQRHLIDRQNRELEEQRRNLRENYFRLSRYERSEFHIDLTAGLAHDLKNPLIAGRQYLRILELDLDAFAETEQGVSPEKAKKFRDETRGILTNIEAVLLQVQERLRDLEQRGLEAEESHPHEGILDPVQVLETALDDIPRGARLSIAFHRDIHEVAPIRAHPDGLRSLFMNLVVNAIEAIPEDAGGDVWIRLYQEDGSVVYVVEDNGCGIAEENLDRVFESRFSTKPRGTGLGLSWVYRNVTQHLGGQIKVESGNLGGDRKTRFTVTLPASAPKKANLNAPPTELRHASPHPDRR